MGFNAFTPQFGVNEKGDIAVHDVSAAGVLRPLAELDNPEHSGRMIRTGAGVLVAYQNWNPFVRTAAGTADDAVAALAHRAIIPGGLMGPNSSLRVTFDAESTVNGTKTFLIKVNGTNIGTPALSGASTNGAVTFHLWNRGATNVQRVANRGFSPFSTTGNAEIPLAVDTTQPFNIDIECRWGAAATAGTDIITVNGMLVELLP